MFIEKELYKNILDTMPIPTVDIIFINTRNEILLGKRNNEPLRGVYYIPGGRVNKGEPSLDIAKRKAFEELGLEIDTRKLQFIGVYDDIFENSAFEGVSTHCISVLYTYILDTEENNRILIKDRQHSDLKFFSMDDNSLHVMIRSRLQDITRKG